MADLSTVSALGIRSKGSWGYTDEEMAVFADELTLTKVSLSGYLAAMVAESSEEIVGYFTLKPHGMRSVELEHMFVDPEHFGEGIGTQLLDAALDESRTRGMRELILISDPNAEGFYRKHGARKIGEHKSSIADRVIPIMSVELS